MINHRAVLYLLYQEIFRLEKNKLYYLILSLIVLAHAVQMKAIPGTFSDAVTLRYELVWTDRRDNYCIKL